MNSKVTNVKVGNGFSKPSKFDFGHTTTTSTHFGEFQCISHRELIPNDEVGVSLAWKTRMNAQYVAPFGESELRVYHTMQKLEDLWRCFPHFIAGQYYRPYDGVSFIPNMIPQISYGALLGIVLNLDATMSKGVNSSRTGYDTGSVGNVNSLRGYIGTLQCGSSNPLGAVSINPTKSFAPFTQWASSLPESNNNFKDFIVYADYDDNDHRSVFDEDVYAEIDNVDATSTTVVIRGGQGTLTVSGSNQTPTSAVGGVGVDPVGSSVPSASNTNRGTGGGRRVQSVSTAGGAIASGEFLLADKDHYTESRIQPLSAFDLVLNYDGQNVICFKLGFYGKLLVKVLKSLGVQFSFRGLHNDIIDINTGEGHSNNISLLPFIGYGRSLFDLNAVQRSLQFSDTNTYALINTISDTPSYLIYRGSDAGQKNLIFNFFQELIKLSYYNLRPDYFSASTTTTGISSQDFNIGSYVGEDSVSGMAVSDPIGIVRSDFTDLALSVRLALKLARIVNKNTILGSSVSKYFLNKYGVDVYSDTFSNSPLLGVDTSLVTSDAIYNQSSSDGAVLGSYGGLSVGQGSGSIHKFRTKSFSYYYAFAVVVPKSGYYQGQRKQHLYRWDFMNEFDSMGYQPILKSELICDTPYARMSDISDAKEVWGVTPRLMDYKTSFNIVNGDMSLPSYANSYEGFTFNRKFLSGLIDTDSCSSPCAPIVNNDSFRTIGEYEQMGNFNRSFLVQSGVCDNILMDFVVKMDVYSHMKPFSESFDTEENADGMLVEKA